MSDQMKAVSIRLPVKVAKWIERRARRKGYSRSSWIRYQVEDTVAHIKLIEKKDTKIYDSDIELGWAVEENGKRRWLTPR